MLQRRQKVPAATNTCCSQRNKFKKKKKILKKILKILKKGRLESGQNCRWWSEVLCTHWAGDGNLKVKVAQSCLTLCDPMNYSPWNSLGQNTGVGSLSLLQQIFPTQGSNWGLLHCRWILYQLSYLSSTQDGNLSLSNSTDNAGVLIKCHRLFPSVTHHADCDSVSIPENSHSPRTHITMTQCYPPGFAMCKSV